MSHTATVQIEFENKEVLKAVCERLGLQFQEGLHSINLYQGSVAAEFSVKLPGWRYPIAIKGKEVKYDNYNGSWGKLRELEKLQDQYSRDVTIQQAEMSGLTWDEEIDEATGEITLNLYDYS